ncbi:hypothetical protein FRC02_007899, partial [Tulasnella sp. 418]
MYNLSSANLVLKTPELVAIIMERLCSWDPDEERVDLKELKNCIRLNRVISREALRLIWRDIDGLSRLIYLLPAEAYSSNKGQNKLRNIDFDLSKLSIWKRVLEVTPQVRRCRYRIGVYMQCTANQTGAWSDPIFMQQYQRAFPERPLFPRLKYLEAYLGSDAVGLAGLVISCPTLRSVVIEIGYGLRHPAIEARRLNVALRTVTSLEKLELWGDGCAASQDMLDIFLQRNDHLKILHLVGSIRLSHLGSLRSLRQLHLLGGVKFPPTQLASQQCATWSGCPLLEELEIEGDLENVEATLRMLELLQALPSKGLTVDAFLDQPSAHRLTLLLTKIRSLVSRKLESLNLHVWLGEEWDEEEVPEMESVLPAGAIEPLYDLKNLKVLHLDVGIPIDFVDDDVAQILSSFPDIEELLLNSKPEYLPYHFATRLSSNSLVQLAISGRKLRKVGVLVNEEWAKLVDTCCSQSVITEVQFGKSTAPFTMSVEEAAGQIVDIFPKIIHLEHRDPYFSQ